MGFVIAQGCGNVFLYSPGAIGGARTSVNLSPGSLFLSFTNLLAGIEWQQSLLYLLEDVRGFFVLQSHHFYYFAFLDVHVHRCALPESPCIANGCGVNNISSVGTLRHYVVGMYLDRLR